MGKGDGKKKRKKKHTNKTNHNNNDNDVHPTTNTAPRVTNNSIIPVRRQIQWANLNKEFRKQQQTGSFRQRKRTKYRKLVNETQLEELLEYRKNHRDPDIDEVLNHQDAKIPLLLVDGYNIIYKWPRLKKHANKGDFAHARRLLISDLEDLQSWKDHWQIQCVFDARNGGRTTVEQSQFGISVVFAGNRAMTETADAYVEQTCRNVAATGHVVIVATDDAMIRTAVETNPSILAFHMSADRLISELKAVRRGISYKVEVAVAKANGHGVRPEALRTRETANLLFNVGAIVVEDKRANKMHRKKRKETLMDGENDDAFIKPSDQGDGDDGSIIESGVPLWTKLPDYTRRRLT